MYIPLVSVYLQHKALPWNLLQTLHRQQSTYRSFWLGGEEHFKEKAREAAMKPCCPQWRAVCCTKSFEAFSNSFQTLLKYSTILKTISFGKFGSNGVLSRQNHGHIAQRPSAACKPMYTSHFTQALLGLRLLPQHWLLAGTTSGKQFHNSEEQDSAVSCAHYLDFDAFWSILSLCHCCQDCQGAGLEDLKAAWNTCIE